MNLDDPRAEIDALHLQAEDLADLARAHGDPLEANRLRKEARRLVQQAARLRQQIGED